MKKNKTFIFIIPFIFISFLCFVNNVEAKKVCDLGENLRNDSRCYKKLPEAITGVASTMNILTTTSTSNNVRLYKTVTCGNTELPENLVKLISIAITAIQVVTPLILIVTGMVDFLKATTSSNEDGIKKAQQTFVRRLIAGAAVFFIILIVKIVVGLVNTKDSGNAIKCIDSILNFKSYDDQRDEAIENTASSCIELYKNGKDYNNCICGLAVTIYNTEGGKIPDSIKKYDELNKLVQSYEGINNLSECPK